MSTESVCLAITVNLRTKPCDNAKLINSQNSFRKKNHSKRKGYLFQYKLSTINPMLVLSGEEYCLPSHANANKQNNSKSLKIRKSKSQKSQKQDFSKQKLQIKDHRCVFCVISERNWNSRRA